MTKKIIASLLLFLLGVIIVFHSAISFGECEIKPTKVKYFNIKSGPITFFVNVPRLDNGYDIYGKWVGRQIVDNWKEARSQNLGDIQTMLETKAKAICKNTPIKTDFRISSDTRDIQYVPDSPSKVLTARYELDFECEVSVSKKEKCDQIRGCATQEFIACENDAQLSFLSKKYNSMLKANSCDDDEASSDTETYDSNSDYK